jgi:hypothetical protein
MKRNAEKAQIEDNDEPVRLRIVESPNGCHGGTSLTLPAAGRGQQTRPEIAVLGWDVRSYRLSLRTSKA